MATMTLSIPDTTFVSSAQPTGNFSFYPLIFTGTDVNFQNCIGFLQITLPSLPVTQVESATLQLAVIAKTGTDPSTVVVNRVDAPFSTATVTYDTRPAFTPTASQINITTSDLYTTAQIDITALVNEWLTGAHGNNGIALTNSDGTTLVEFATDNIAYEPYFPKLVLTYSSAPEESSALNFSYAQLAHVIEQLIVLYPTDVMTVFTKGLTASSVTGTPYQLYQSSVGTYGGLLIVLDSGQEQAIPLNSITAIYTGDGTVYNPSISYLTSTGFPAGYDTNIITAYHDYLPLLAEVELYTGSNIYASGTVYKNEYGILVLSDEEGNTPIFTPVIPITIVLPVTPAIGLQETKHPMITVEK